MILIVKDNLKFLLKCKDINIENNGTIEIEIDPNNKEISKMEKLIYFSVFYKNFHFKNCRIITYLESPEKYISIVKRGEMEVGDIDYVRNFKLEEID